MNGGEELKSYVVEVKDVDRGGATTTALVRPNMNEYKLANLRPGGQVCSLCPVCLLCMCVVVFDDDVGLLISFLFSM